MRFVVATSITRLDFRSSRITDRSAMPAPPQPEDQSGDRTRDAAVAAALTRLEATLRTTHRCLDAFVEQLTEQDAPATINGGPVPAAAGSAGISAR